jgi:uncharacterized membrane protein YjgN (DUF898 family)
MDDVVIAQPVEAHRSARVVFSDPPGAFRKLVWRGAALELITAGFYRFWLATDMRRQLWSHTSIEGDSFEYTGTAKELLIGFLFALAILVPVYLVYFLIGIEAERYKAFASAPLGLFFYAFFQFAIFRARRYRASRTVWRGVRFWMTGSGWLYALRAGLWGLLILITLGTALPWRDAALERYKMRHTFCGDVQGRFDGTGWGLFKKVWWLGLLTFVLFGIIFAFPVTFAVNIAKFGPRSPQTGALVGSIIISIFLTMVLLPFIFAIYKARSWRWWISGIRIGDVRFDSNLRGGALIGLYLAVIGWAVLIVVVDMIVVSAASAAVVAIVSGGKMNVDGATLGSLASTHIYALYAVLVLNYLLMALAIGTVMRIYFLRGIWKKVADSTTVHNLEAVDNVMVKGDPASALGEGFANSLDVAGF